MVAHVVRQIRRRGGNVQMQREFGNAQCEKAVSYTHLTLPTIYSV